MYFIFAEIFIEKEKSYSHFYMQFLFLLIVVSCAYDRSMSFPRRGLCALSSASGGESD